MTEIDPSAITGAEVLLPCSELTETLRFFTRTVGMRVDAIYPADDPTQAALSGHGLHLRLVRDLGGDPGRLQVHHRGPFLTVQAPNGTTIEFIPAERALEVPPGTNELVITRKPSDLQLHTGRAGMQYRDLIPGRLGGRFIASHIHIPDGGPVPDYVHFHKVRFQMIFCYRGWFDVVYEDQGEPFRVHAGGCVLQPPEIRHRVLHASPGMEVIEIGCPAEHETFADHDMTLPTGRYRPDRQWDSQRFVSQRDASAPWVPWHSEGWQCRDTGIGEATDGLAGVRVVRPSGEALGDHGAHQGEFAFYVVLDGTVTLDVSGHGTETLSCGDAISIPSGTAHRWHSPSTDLELFECTLPADLPVHRQ